MINVAIDKIGSATSPIQPDRTVRVSTTPCPARVGDVVAVRALSESATYGHLELPTGRLAKINRGDSLLGVLGTRRALKGFVGDVPETIAPGDRLHLLNMGGVIGVCSGHHSSHTDAIEVEVIGPLSDSLGFPVNIGDRALPPAANLVCSVPIVIVAGSCMNSGKTVAAIEIIRQAASAGLRVAGAKLTGVACLRDTLNMEDHGAFATASFLDSGLPSTVGHPDLPSVAKGLLNHLASQAPDLIVAELGDGIVGGYGVEKILGDHEFKNAISSFVYCAPDYVAVAGGLQVLSEFGIKPDVIAGSVTDSQMGEDFVQNRFRIAAGNARRDGAGLFGHVRTSVANEVAVV